MTNDCTTFTQEARQIQDMSITLVKVNSKQPVVVKLLFLINLSLANVGSNDAQN